MKSGMIVPPGPKAGHRETPQHSTHHVVMQASTSEPNTVLNHGALAYERVSSIVVLPQVDDTRKGES